MSGIFIGIVNGVEWVCYSDDPADLAAMRAAYVAAKERETILKKMEK